MVDNTFLNREEQRNTSIIIFISSESIQTRWRRKQQRSSSSKSNNKFWKGPLQDYGDPKPARTLKSLTVARERTHKTCLSGAQLAGRYTQQSHLPLGDYLLLTDPSSDMRLSVTGRGLCSTLLCLRGLGSWKVNSHQHQRLSGSVS